MFAFSHTGFFHKDFPFAPHRNEIKTSVLPSCFDGGCLYSESVMFQDAYIKLDQLETADILERISPHLHGGKIPPENCVVMTRELPFYPGYRFFDISSHTVLPALRRFVLEKDGDVVVLDFTNVPIYDLNKRCPLVLTGENILDYVRFFFTFVRGRHGRFLITESVDDIQWREEPPPAARKSVAKMIEPLHLKEEEKASEHPFHLVACMMFRDSLFRAEVTVDSAGNVQLSREHLLIEDMPVLDDTFGQ